MIKVISTKKWLPDYMADSILDLDNGTLKADGITHIVFDLDNTLASHGINTITPEYIHSVDSLKKAGFTVLLGSNTRRDISIVTKQLDIEAVRPSGLTMKPSKAYYNLVIAATGTSPDHIAMAGDHIINDVWGGNRSGVTTIMIKNFKHKTSRLHRHYVKYALKYAK